MHLFALCCWRPWLSMKEKLQIQRRTCQRRISFYIFCCCCCNLLDIAWYFQRYIILQNVYTASTTHIKFIIFKIRNVYNFSDYRGVTIYYKIYKYSQSRFRSRAFNKSLTWINIRLHCLSDVYIFIIKLIEEQIHYTSLLIWH